MLRASAFLVALVLAPALAVADEMSPAVAAAGCSACHGLDGKSSGAIPSLDRIDAATMTAKLKGFKAGELNATIMNRIAKGFSDAEIDSLVKFMVAK
jgi:cytochrome c553